MISGSAAVRTVFVVVMSIVQAVAAIASSMLLVPTISPAASALVPVVKGCVFETAIVGLPAVS